jgi:hypothetical protein
MSVRNLIHTAAATKRAGMTPDSARRALWGWTSIAPLWGRCIFGAERGFQYPLVISWLMRVMRPFRSPITACIRRCASTSPSPRASVSTLNMQLDVFGLTSCFFAPDCICSALRNDTTTAAPHNRTHHAASNTVDCIGLPNDNRRRPRRTPCDGPRDALSTGCLAATPARRAAPAIPAKAESAFLEI